jgi:hypothetical protein
LNINELNPLIEGAINKIKNKISSTEFIEKHRASDKAFTRKRVFTFQILFSILINILKSCLSTELDNFLKNLSNSAFLVSMATDGAFSKARKKLKESAFVELFQIITSDFYNNFEYKRWHGYRLIACDGTKLNLPRNASTIKAFGKSSNQREGFYVQAQVSALYDVLNEFIIDAHIDHVKTGERTLLGKHLPFLQPTDILLADRGYPSFWLLAYLLKHRVNFCLRTSTVNTWKEITQMLANGETDKIVNFPCSYKSIKKLEKLGLTQDPISVRISIVELKDGEKEVLISSLFDQDEFSLDALKDLYFLRWGIEEKYKQTKHRIEIANFSGKTPISIRQDFFAKIFTMNLTALLMFPVKKQIDEDSMDRKYGYKTNWSKALGKVKNFAFKMFLVDPVMTFIENLQYFFRRYIIPIRPNRSYPRKKNNIARKYHPTYKSHS